MNKPSAILTYHSIDDSGSPISVHPDLFRRHMELLAQSKAPVVPLDRVRAVPGSIAITFDDGFANFLDAALPTLCAHRLPATVFVVSGYAGADNGWPSQPPGIPRLPLMKWDELRHLPRNGVSLGVHTVSHPYLSRISADRVREELRECRAAIREHTGFTPELFAWPYGDLDLRVRQIVAREFTLACGTGFRLLSTGDDPLELPRIDAYYLRNGWAMRDLLGSRGRAYIRARGWIRQAGQRLRARENAA